jgi:hypothetical protein
VIKNLLCTCVAEGVLKAERPGESEDPDDFACTFEDEVDAICSHRFTTDDLADSLPPKTYADLLVKADRRAKKLAGERFENFRTVLGAASDCFLVQAPPGSGKTVLCIYIYIALEFLHGRTQLRPSTTKRLLLLTVSTALVRQCAAKIESATRQLLEVTLTRDADINHDSRAVLVLQHGADLGATEVHVCTIDNLMAQKPRDLYARNEESLGCVL